MLVDILNIIFSGEYLVIGALIAALLDISIHYTKSTTRFTLLEIWGCTLFWPIVLVLVIILCIKSFFN
jgi:hypothetical protein